MELVNPTRLVAGYTVATDKQGRESLVVVAKGSYGIPSHPSEAPRLLDTPCPLVTTDEFFGEPGGSAVKYENDFAPCKPRCDVLLNGSCHAPSGQPATEVTVAILVAGLTKAFRVVGPRRHGRFRLGWGPGAPEPFTHLPIRYDLAFGGVDRADEDPRRHRWHALNPVGVGLSARPDASAGHDLAWPLTEELDKPVRSRDSEYRPMAFGAIGRSWQPRIAWGGTYDQDWLDHHAPFLPPDFDTRYFQSAPEDQQIDPPRGGEDVALLNLTPQGRTMFKLPAKLGLPVLFVGRDGQTTEVPAVVDTLLLEPDEGRFMLVWRASLALRRNVREIVQVQISKTRERLLAQRAHAERLRGKHQFASLAEAVAWAAQTRRDEAREDEQK
jgi:hypothetical protein